MKEDIKLGIILGLLYSKISQEDRHKLEQEISSISRVLVDRVEIDV